MSPPRSTSTASHSSKRLMVLLGALSLGFFAKRDSNHKTPSITNARREITTCIEARPLLFPSLLFKQYILHIEICILLLATSLKLTRPFQHHSTTTTTTTTARSFRRQMPISLPFHPRHDPAKSFQSPLKEENSW